MISVLLIGMGKFGRTLGEKLLNMGDEVMIVDKDEEVINSLSKTYTHALIANCMIVENIKSLDVSSYDVCVVAIGEDFQSSLEITANLKDLGAKRVISKATTEIQKKFLMRIGADEVVFPDMDMAERLAVKLSSSNVINFVDLGANHAIFEIGVPRKWRKRSIIEINPREKYGMNILTIKKPGQNEVTMPDGNYRFEETDSIVVFGDTEKILSLVNK